jgi:acyl-CoA reductase-like NAD-dependent aldehyde dehydrogenase
MLEKISWEPLGVIANISAWNYPYFVSTNVILPGLLTGNTILFKPSEYSSFSGIAMVKLLHQSGIPKEVLIPVIGGGNVGATLISQKELSGVFFTGSKPTGEKIATACAKNMVKLQEELGGKDPFYVCEDVADIASTAASLADGAFFNNGQSCCSVERIYVHSSIYKEFVGHFVKEVKSFTMGDPMDEKTYLGPLTRSAQIDILKSQVEDALTKGATLLLGGKPTTINGRGYYFEPTVLVNVNHTMDVMRDESFGPIIGIQPVNSDEEAIALMNDTEFGLTSGVYSSNKKRAETILEQINSGTVYWNCCDRVSPNLPWSGRKGSGIGITLSKEGIKTFLKPKAWHLKSL